MLHPTYSGTIGALNTASTASTSLVGVAPGTQVVAVKVLDDTGIGSDSTVASGLKWVAENAKKLNIKVLP